MRTLLACLLLPAALAAPASAAFEPVPGNPADRLAGELIDDYRYDRADRCRRAPTPGARALEDWLRANARGSSWGIMRCEKLGPESYSLHAEGRAIDWHLDAARPGERREAYRLIRLFLAPDRAGNPHALARRMGIQELIFDCRAWWSGGEGLRRYSACYDGRGRRRRGVSKTIAHRDHIHIGLTSRGAWLKTSFWDAARR